MWSVSNKSKTTADRSESFESGNSRCHRDYDADEKSDVINGGFNSQLDGDFLRVNLPCGPEAKTHPSSMSKSPLEVYADGSANELENLSPKAPSVITSGSFDEELKSFESEKQGDVDTHTSAIGEHLEPETNLLSFGDADHIQNLIANSLGRSTAHDEAA